MESCLEKTPFMSLIGFTLVFFGSGVMCSTIYDAIKRSERVFVETFYPVSYVFPVQIATFSFALFTMIYAIAMVIIGATNTGETRDSINRKKPLPTQGRCGLHTHIAFSYLLLFLWLVAFLVVSLPVLLWVMFSSICYEETSYWIKRENKDEKEFSYVFNLRHYGLYRGNLDKSKYTEEVKSANGFTRLCSEISSIGPMFGCASVAIVFIICGINTFIACLATAVARFKYIRELNSFRNALSKDSGQQQANARENFDLVPVNATLDAEKFAVLNTQLTMKRNQKQSRPTNTMPIYGSGNSVYYQQHATYMPTNATINGAGEGTYGGYLSQYGQPLLQHSSHYRSPSQF